MRLPLRHPPPRAVPAPARCAYLEELLAASVGLSLASAAEALTTPGSRGRHGNALQWHLGLATHDGHATLDWEGRIEVKLVSLWRTPAGQVTCDKLKVCDEAQDPWHKLSNVAFVFADRLSRVIVGARWFHLAGPARDDLVASWALDPDFGRPDLFLEARASRGGASAPAYYLSAAWLRRHLWPVSGASVLVHDPAAWRAARVGGRDPLWALAGAGDGPARCPRCGGRVHPAGPPDWRARLGWTPAVHAMPLRPPCAGRGAALLDPARLFRGAGPFAPDEQVASLCAVRPPFRLSDRVLEPDDHMHGAALAPIGPGEP